MSDEASDEVVSPLPAASPDVSKRPCANFGSNLSSAPGTLVRMHASAPALSLAEISAPSKGALNERSDDELMLLSRDGTQVAFEVLVRRHQERVLRVAARYLGSTSLARDVAQNAFLELYRSRIRYEPRAKFMSFLCCIVLNQCRMLSRSARSGARLEASLAKQVEGAASTGGDESRDLALALSRLSEKLRVVVILRTGPIST